MPRKYYRRYKRKTASRGYRRRGKKLSKFNVFTKKSAKSQASQIYALNKKINRVAKRTRQDIIRYDTPTQDYTIAQWGNGAQTAGQNFSLRCFTSIPGFAETFTIKDYYLQLKMFYNNPTSTAAYNDGQNVVGATGDVFVRMVAIRYLSSQEDAIPYADVMPANGIYAISQPLDPNIGKRCKIIRDKVFHISAKKPMIQINYRFKCGYREIKQDSQVSRRKGEIEIFFYCYNCGRTEAEFYGPSSYATVAYGQRYYYYQDLH